MKLSDLKQQIEELDASYFPREAKCEKDALLITHGPELLRRLLAAEEAFIDVLGSASPNKRDNPSMFAAWKKATAALATIRGEEE